MTDDLEKVDLAALYREVATCMSQQDDKEVRKILEKVKKEASKGKFTLKIEVDEDIYNWVNYPLLSGRKIKPDLVSKLENYGFRLGNGNFNVGIFGIYYTVVISWQGK